MFYMLGRVFAWNLFITRPLQTKTTPIKPALDNDASDYASHGESPRPFGMPRPIYAIFL